MLIIQLIVILLKVSHKILLIVLPWQGKEKILRVSVVKIIK